MEALIIEGAENNFAISTKAIFSSLSSTYENLSAFACYTPATPSYM